MTRFDYEQARRNMIEQQIRTWDVLDARVLDLLSAVRREEFVPPAYRTLAFADLELPLPNGFRMWTPKMEARVLQELMVQSTDRVLEIGTGSGYQTALLSLVAESVFSVERVPALAQQAREALQSLGLRNVTVLVGDGTLGWRPFAPYDAILVAAASPNVPEPLVDQLAPGGRLIIPLGSRESQELTLVRRTADGIQTSVVADVRFVPLLGEFGFRGS